MVEVTQADRDAAADWLAEDGLDWGYCGDVRKGFTDHALVQAFARHRLAQASADRPVSEPKDRYHKDMREHEIEALARDMCNYPDIRAPVQGYPGGIPWEMHMRAYGAYSEKWSPQVALIDLYGRGCRGGFGVKELDGFIPGWRDELTERQRLLARLAQQQTRADQQAEWAMREAKSCAELEARLAQQEAAMREAVEAVAELQLAAFLAGRGSVTSMQHGTRTAKPAPTMDEFRNMARTTLLSDKSEGEQS